MNEFRPGPEFEQNSPDRKVRQITHRNYETYITLFNLPEIYLSDAKKVVDVGAGFSSFCQEARERFSGLRSIAVDPVYKIIKDNPDITLKQLEQQEDIFLDFNPDYRGESNPSSFDQFDQNIIQYYQNFIKDVKSHPTEYLAESHQNIPLEDDSVDLVLASNSIIRIENKPQVIKKALQECLRILKNDGEIRVAGNIACLGFEPTNGNLELWFNGELAPKGSWVEEFKKTGHYSDPELMEVFQGLETTGAKFYVVIIFGKDQYDNEVSRVDTIIIRKDQGKPVISLSRTGESELRIVKFKETDGFNISTEIV